MFAFCFNLNSMSSAVDLLNIAANGDVSLELGAFVHAIENESGEKTYTATLRSLSLIGDYSHEILDTPSISNFLRITPISEDSFTIEAGASAVNHIFRFEPKGISSQSDEALEAFMTENPTAPFYIFESKNGVRITYKETFKRRNLLAAMPNQFFREFAGSDAMSQLKATLIENVPDTSGFELINGSIVSRPIASWGPLSPDISYAEVIFTILDGQVARVATESPQPLDFSAQPFSLEQDGPSALRYRRMAPSNYMHISELAALSNKYTVRIFEYLDKQKIGCRIQVYPNARGEYGMVVTFDKTWLHVETLGDSFEDALSSASHEIAKLID